MTEYLKVIEHIDGIPIKRRPQCVLQPAAHCPMLENPGDRLVDVSSCSVKPRHSRRSDDHITNSTTFGNRACIESFSQSWIALRALTRIGVGTSIGSRAPFTEIAGNAAKYVMANHQARRATPFAGQTGFNIQQSVTWHIAARTGRGQAVAKRVGQTPDSRHPGRVHMGAHVCLDECTVVA
jgi:hypothetical protein